GRMRKSRKSATVEDVEDHPGPHVCEPYTSTNGQSSTSSTPPIVCNEARRRLRWEYKRQDPPARRRRHRPHKDSLSKQEEMMPKTSLACMCRVSLAPASWNPQANASCNLLRERLRATKLRRRKK